MIELRTIDMAHGGEAVARVDGKAHFVAGALPGERVLGEIVKEKRSWARVELREVLEPAPERIAPSCANFGTCGGCQWQFADHHAQLAWKEGILSGQLAHLGGVEAPPVRPTLAVGPAYGYRNRMDFRVVDGRPALYRRRSRVAIPIESCVVLRPELAELFGRLGDLRGVETITIRSSAASGDTMAVVRGVVPDHADEWGCTVAMREGDTVRPIIGTGSVVERIEGVDLRVTADAFFQNNSEGAGALVRLVATALEVQPDDVLLDAYAGGGLFGVTVGSRAQRVLAVETNPLAIADFTVNAATVDHRLFMGSFGDVDIPDRWSVAVVDPPRTGLGERGVEAVVATRPRTLAYVSCDPASLARDTKLLRASGYRLDWVQPVDMFPQTFHVEAVARFVL